MYERGDIMKKTLQLLSLLYIIFMAVLFVYYFPKGVSHSYQVALGGILCGLILLILLCYSKMNIPNALGYSVLAFLFASQYLGSIAGWYSLGWWDTFLHFLSGILLAYVGLAILERFLSKNKQMRSLSGLVFFFVLSFAVLGGVIWEMYEFSADQLFQLTLQGGGNIDTMGDLIADFCGGLLIAVVSALNIKTRIK